MKRGFTLVELSIVLVIIGLIVGMTIKGKSLVDTAYIRSEMARIKKLEAAAATYLAMTGKIPLTNSQLIDSGVLASNVFKSRMAVDNLSFIGCTRYYTQKYWPHPNIFAVDLVNASPEGSCIFIDSKKDKSRISSRYACYIEVILDDMNYYEGSLGRQYAEYFNGPSQPNTNFFYDGSVIKASEIQQFDDCDKNEGKVSPYLMKML